jgi:cysteine desulfurase
MRIYLDNAATTPLDPDVLEAMLPFFQNHFGNPSSIHAHGRECRAAIEKARRTVADLLGASPSEIFFTSGGTEADNAALSGSVRTNGIKTAISTRIEHHAVLHCLENLVKTDGLQLHFLDLDEKGHISLTQLEELLAKYPHSLVSLMHANNEIGNLNNLEAIAASCKQYGSLFHSDTVQTMGHYPHKTRTLNLDFLVGSAHKFHGPKGTGFLYINSRNKIAPFIQGGAQERNMRGGTENVAGIVGLAKALEIAYSEMDAHRKHIEALKSRMIANLNTMEGIRYNGASADLENSLYTVLNVSLPPNEAGDMLLFNLDIAGVSVSGGSACSSGSEIGSHVLRAIGHAPERGAVRFSFSKFNTPQEIDFAAQQVKLLYPSPVTV